MTRGDTPIFATFEAWFERDVLPLRKQKRLDGAESGGNREIAGRFRHLGTTWKVHADTHVEPLTLAFEAARRGEEPFKVGSSATGHTLELVDALQRRRRTTHKHLYIYEQKSP